MSDGSSELRFDHVLFDLDGTLSDPGLGITNSVMHALKHWNIEVEDRASLYRFIGPPLLDSFRDFCGFDPEECQEALRIYREYFSVKGLYENELYPGVTEMLDAVRAAGKQVVLATSKPEEYAVEILRHFNILDRFDVTCGASMDEKLSRKADVIRLAMERAGITDPDRCVMVGDREHDAIGAREAGIRCIGVLYGYGSREELENAGAFRLAATPAEILKQI